MSNHSSDGCGLGPRTNGPPPPPKRNPLRSVGSRSTLRYIKSDTGHARSSNDGSDMISRPSISTSSDESFWTAELPMSNLAALSRALSPLGTLPLGANGSNGSLSSLITSTTVRSDAAFAESHPHNVLSVRSSSSTMSSPESTRSDRKTGAMTDLSSATATLAYDSTRNIIPLLSTSNGSLRDSKYTVFSEEHDEINVAQLQLKLSISPSTGHAIKTLPNGMTSLPSPTTPTDMSYSVDLERSSMCLDISSLEQAENSEQARKDDKLLAHLPSLSDDTSDVHRRAKQVETPKIGGFGVRSETLVPYAEGMISPATTRAIDHENRLQKQQVRQRASSEHGHRNSGADEISSRGCDSLPMAHLPSESTVNGHRRSHFRGQSASDGQGWGANFWCVITDPTSDASFFANPETGECRWEVPAGTIVLPPNPAGEWWELIDEQRDLPYFYHTQTGESVWEKPEGLVIPLVAVQESVLGRPISRPNLRSTCDSRDASSSSLSSSKSATDSICESSASSSSSVDVGILPSGTDDALTQNEIKSPSVVGEDSSPNTPKAKRRSIRFRDSPPSPPVESPTIEQVLASRARRSIITYDREVLAQALASPTLRQAFTAPSTSITAPSSTSDPSTTIEGRRSPDTRTDVRQRTPSIHFEGDRILASSKTLMERRHVTPSQDMAIPRYTSLSTFPSRQSTSPRKSIIRTASQWSPDADIPPVPPLPEGYPTSRSSTMAYVSNKESPENSSPSHRRIVRRERDPVKRVAPLPLDYSIGDTAVQIPTPRPVPRQRKSTISISTKRMSTGDHQCMPAELQSAIQAFKFEDFALQMFAIHRTGPLRRKVGIEQLVSWQSSGIGASLLQLEFKELQRDAIQIFRIIRNCMGDREESPVSRPGSRACSRPSSRAGSRPPSRGDLAPCSSFGTRVLSCGSGPNMLVGTPLRATTGLARLDRTFSHSRGDSREGARIAQGRSVPASLSSILSHSASANQSGPAITANERLICWTESLILQVRWMLERGLASRALRDEIYVQLVKQLTKNPSDSSILRGWQLLSAIVVTFPPSKQLAGYLLAFIDGHVMKSGCGRQTRGKAAAVLGLSTDGDVTVAVEECKAVLRSDVSTMATHCLSRLKMIAQSGARTQTPLAEEIVVASRAAFLPCVFGKTLNEVMQVQVVLSPGRNLPKVLVFLCESILANGGPRTEGVFRMAGQIELVTELRCRIDCGNYCLDGLGSGSRGFGTSEDIDASYSDKQQLQQPGDIPSDQPQRLPASRKRSCTVLQSLTSLGARGGAFEHSVEAVGMAAALSRKAISGAEIVHVLVSTLKLFLRELATPIIPVSLYDRLLQCSLSATKIESILSTMPALHRRVLVYLLQFMQAFLPPVSKLPTLSRMTTTMSASGATASATTSGSLSGSNSVPRSRRPATGTSTGRKMDPEALALIFAPLLFQSPVSKLSLIFNNSRFEQQVLVSLLAVDWSTRSLDSA